MKKNKQLRSSIMNRQKRRPVFFNRGRQIFRNLLTNKLIIAIVSGVFVGTMFGLTVLYMLNTDQAETAIDERGASPAASSSLSSEAMVALDLDMPSIYVLQVGVFHERENAELTKRQLERRKIDTFIWERDEQYFLLESVHDKEAAAKSHYERLQEKQIDTFVKKWDISLRNQRVTENERIWLEQFISLWNQSLEQSTNDQAIALSQWEKLIEEELDSTPISDLQIKVKDHLPKLENKEASSLTLLKILQEIEKIITS